MTKTALKSIPYRRVREKKTNYRKRKSLLTSGLPRLVARFTNQRVIGQVIEFTPRGDKVLAGTDSFALRKFGWKGSCKNSSAAYLLGVIVAKKTLAKGEKKAILDVGFKNPKKKGKLYAFLKGVVDGGLHVPHEKEIFPEEKRIFGKHEETFLQVKKALLK